MVDYDRLFSEITRRFRASDVRELLKLTEGKRVISFAGGLPDPRVFPAEELADIARNVVSELGDKALQYSPTPGVSIFRERALSFLERMGLKTSDRQLLVTTGSQEALFLTALSTLSPGDVVIMEEPGYLAAINVFKALGARIVPVPVDDKGLNTGVLAETLDRLDAEGVKPKLVYTNPTCNNPNGTTMPLDRRRELLQLASNYDMLVIEDDPYSHIAFEKTGEEVPLQALDSEGRVVYVTTFSKILAPGLRLGLTLAPSEVTARIELLKQIVDLHTSTLDQYIAAEALERGIVDKVISRAVSIYRRKRDIMIESLEENMSGVATWTKPIGGFFIFLRINGPVDMRALMPKAVERGVAYVPGDAFHVTPGAGRNTARLSYSFNTEEEIPEGISILSKLVKEVLS
ncbi:alanine glyoxylate transaminase [Aeropyrum pernix K1]|uniref:Alanine glyoxylate transaminase n=1 Tax=Aeropyrum pernix (strain ATCC 700893 / DSM 11879 / JCM 9820 / NBRC 100138 / K1) TaxID=272557 RepID=Q9YFT1_AERPE|nr:PLP-dependent aminotransferase family protein [Aeropyrum pernix]BAA79080.2 alanine glyoxylate transaminase [Aeropyrum pernix K1]